jgi:hypothetical protein
MKFDINNFGPFQSDVWGSFSDWVMLIVTFFTLLYLIKTFKAQHNSLGIQQKTLESQLVVQKAQQLSTEIEQKRYESEIRPDVSVSLDNEQKMVILTPTNRNLRDLTYSTSQETKGLVDYNHIRNQPPNTYVVGNPIELRYKWNKNSPSYLLFSIDLLYLDEINTPYEVKSP